MENLITIKEFIKLPVEEKSKRYKDMSEHDKYLWRTQYEPIQATVTGHFEMTEEEKKAADLALNQILRNIGVLKD